MSEHEHEYQLDVKGNFYYCFCDAPDLTITDLMAYYLEANSRILALEGVVEAAKRLERLYQLDTEYFEDRPGTLGYVTDCIIEALKKLEEV
jgi:hypothetical protein